MARFSEQSEGADTLPNPELNPLLNPLLADNMGRWAEVYFTAPPEKREDAVLDLLHQLEQERRGTARSEPAAAPAQQSVNLIPPPPLPMDFDATKDQTANTYCASCGHENPSTHQFCGMCGSKLEPASQRETRIGTWNQASREAEPDDRESAPETEYEAASRSGEMDERRPAHDFYPPASNSELSLFQSFRQPYEQDEPEYEEEPPSPPYRFYIAAVLAIIIAVLGYMAWRGSQGNQSAGETSAPPPAPASEAAPPAANKSPAANSSSTASPPAHEEGAQKTPPATASRETEKKAAPATAHTAPTKSMARKAPTPAPAPEAATPAASAADNGSAELVTAQRYLNGSAGRGRDSAEAAKWLWRSMAKHNGEATLLLADLYLKGDGVLKNCDQGRVLLDSAARRGIAGAGERLRNLQAFGCH